MTATSSPSPAPAGLGADAATSYRVDLTYRDIIPWSPRQRQRSQRHQPEWCSPAKRCPSDQGWFRQQLLHHDTNDLTGNTFTYTISNGAGTSTATVNVGVMQVDTGGNDNPDLSARTYDFSYLATGDGKDKFIGGPAPMISSAARATTRISFPSPVAATILSTSPYWEGPAATSSRSQRPSAPRSRISIFSASTLTWLDRLTIF